nr:DUF885 family protein [Novosphingobium sp.]
MSYAGARRAPGWGSARETLAEATAFVAEKGLIRMGDGPVKVITMPKFQQGNAVAYNDPPGPFESTCRTSTPSPDPRGVERCAGRQLLSEYNDYMIHDLSIHEAMPGHYLQLDHSNRTDNPAAGDVVVRPGLSKAGRSMPRG